MEPWIILSAAIAFGALIAVIWNSDRDLKEKNRRLEIAETRLAALAGEAGGAPSTISLAHDETTAELESQVSRLTDERARLLDQIEDQKKQTVAVQEVFQSSGDPEGQLERLKQQLATLGSENSQLRSRIEDYERERSSREQRALLLQGEEAKIPELEHRISKLREENDQFLSQIEELTRAQEASRKRTQELEGAQSRVADLEQNLTQLREENSKQSKKLSDFRNSVHGKLKAQLNALQKLYQDIESPKA